jgi:uncharacterized protein (DUF433 family)
MDDSLLAFTPDQVSRLTGLSERQLWQWDKSGFFRPEYSKEERPEGEARRRPYTRLYSFRDVVGLRTLGSLRNRYRIPLQQLKIVGQWLQEHHETPWASLHFFVRGRQVYFDDPDSGGRVATRPPGQMAFPIEMEKIAGEVRRDVERIRARPAEQMGQVTQNRNVVQNAPVIAGTRIPTQAIWNFHQAGYSVDDIIREYPDLTEDDVHAAINYESQQRSARAG